MLSKRMTAKSLELNPASQARNRMVNDSRDCHPAGCDRPPDSPPPPPALLPLSATAVLLRPFPEYATPEFSEDLCLFSETGWCSAIFYVSPVVASKRSELSVLAQERTPSFFLFSATLHFQTHSHHLPCGPRTPQITGSISKLSNLTSHRPRNQFNNPRELHSSAVLQLTGNDTHTRLEQFFLPSLELDERGREQRVEQEALSASHNETGTAEEDAVPEETQSTTKRIWQTAKTTNDKRATWPVKTLQREKWSERWCWRGGDRQREKPMARDRLSLEPMK